MKPRKREQYYVTFMKASQLQFVGKDLLFVCNSEEDSDMTPVSENRVFRHKKFYDVKSIVRRMRNEEGEKVLTELPHKKVTKFYVFENDLQDDADMSVSYTALTRGIFVKHRDGSVVHIKRCLRSASQYRTAKMLMTHADLVEEVRDWASYRWVRSIEGRQMVVAKVEPYISLALTSDISAGRGWTAVYIDDYEGEIDMSDAIVQDKEGNLVSFEEATGRKTEKSVPTDGQAFGRPEAFARISFKTSVITPREYRMVRKQFKAGYGYRTQMASKELRKIWKKIAVGVQFRWGIDKGFIYMYEHDFKDEDGNIVDFVIPDGATKAKVEYENTGYTQRQLELCIANFNKNEEKEWGNLNYQFINALNISFEELRDLAILAIEKIKTAVKSVENAMSFLNMCQNAENVEEETHVMNLQRLLEANPRSFQTRWVKTKVKNLMRKKIADMRMGRIPVEDSRFVYIITDPKALTGTPLLKKGEYYYNGRVGKATIFRSPLVDESEPVVINCAHSEELDRAFGHLKNILIMNVHDDTLPRMGGADTDGDKVYLVFDKEFTVNTKKSGVRVYKDLIQSTVKKNSPLIYGDLVNAKPQKVEWTNENEEHIVDYDSKLFKGSDIGIITDYATTWSDRMKCKDTTETEIQKYRDYVRICRILQGKIIDAPKTGIMVQIPQELRTKDKPHWLRDVPRADVYSTPGVYPSTSPLGKLYDFISDQVLPAFKEWLPKDKKTIKLLDDSIQFDGNVVRSIHHEISRLEENYRQSLNDFGRTHPEPKREDYFSRQEWQAAIDHRNDLMKELLNRHRDMLNMYSLPTMETAVACIYLTQCEDDRSEAKSASYPFVIAFEYMLAFFQNLQGQFTLVRAKHVDETLWTERVTIENHKIFIDKHLAGYASVSDGEYETHVFENQYFIKVPSQSVKVDLPSKEVKEQAVQFEIKGFKTAGGFDHYREVMKLISAQEIVVENVENDFLVTKFANKRVAWVGAESDLERQLIKNKRMHVVNVKEYKGKLVVNANILGDYTPVKEEEPVTPIIEEPTQDYNMEDGEVYYYAE